MKYFLTGLGMAVLGFAILYALFPGNLAEKLIDRYRTGYEMGWVDIVIMALWLIAWLLMVGGPVVFWIIRPIRNKIRAKRYRGERAEESPGR